MLTNGERAALEAVVGRLIPADETGPGAVEAGVPRYLEGVLADAYRDALDVYRVGLACLDESARALGAPSFALLGTEQQDTILSSFEAGQDSAERAFFELVRAHTIEGMFGDPSHGGNEGGVGWALIGFPGVRPVQGADDQALGSVAPRGRTGAM